MWCHILFWWLVLILGDEQQTGICKVRACGCVHCTWFCSQMWARQQHSNVRHSWGCCLVFTQAPVCFALEENAAWLLALREESQRRKQCWHCRDQKTQSSYFGYWQHPGCKGEGLRAALQPALEVCSHGWAVTGFRVADWKLYKAYSCTGQKFLCFLGQMWRGWGGSGMEMW